MTYWSCKILCLISKPSDFLVWSLTRELNCSYNLKKRYILYRLRKSSCKFCSWRSSYTENISQGQKLYFQFPWIVVHHTLCRKTYQIRSKIQILIWYMIWSFQGPSAISGGSWCSDTISVTNVCCWYDCPSSSNAGTDHDSVYSSYSGAPP
jgi:hypothetical protein